MDKYKGGSVQTVRSRRPDLARSGGITKEPGEQKKNEKGANRLSGNKNLHPSNIQVIHK